MTTPSAKWSGLITMTKDEKLIQLILDQNKKIQNTPTQISNQHKSTKTLLYAVWFTS